MKIAFLGDSLTAGIPGASYFDVLCKLLPHHDLVNLSRPGDSVIEAYQRAAMLDSNAAFDMIFLWIGTNDVFVKASWTFPCFRWLLRQSWAKNEAEFLRYYGLILDNLHRKAKYVYAVSPGLVGEDLNNEWNVELEKWSIEVKTLTSTYKNVDYLNVREIFKVRLASKRISKYVARSALGVGRDALTLRNVEQINKISRNRGLHYTLDGVHLNEQGAEIVARIFIEAIRKT